MGSIFSTSRFSVLTCALAMAAAGALEGCSSSSAKSDAAVGTGGAGGSATGTGGAGGSATGTGGAGGGGATTLTLTSTAFTEGQTIPAENTCAGINTSPPLSWTAGPAATLSYAVVLTDLANMTIHWLIWDIPAAPPHALMAALPNTATLTNPAGAKQAHHIPFFMNNDNGYRARRRLDRDPGSHCRCS